MSYIARNLQLTPEQVLTFLREIDDAKGSRIVLNEKMFTRTLPDDSFTIIIEIVNKTFMGRYHSGKLNLFEVADKTEKFIINTLDNIIQ